MLRKENHKSLTHRKNFFRKRGKKNAFRFFRSFFPPCLSAPKPRGGRQLSLYRSIFRAIYHRQRNERAGSLVTSLALQSAIRKELSSLQARAPWRVIIFKFGIRSRATINRQGRSVRVTRRIRFYLIRAGDHQSQIGGCYSVFFFFSFAFRIGSIAVSFLRIGDQTSPR